MHHSMRISMPTDISKNEKNPWKMMQLPDILKSLYSLSRALWNKIGSVIQMTFSSITQEQFVQMTLNFQQVKI